MFWILYLLFRAQHEESVLLQSNYKDKFIISNKITDSPRHISGIFLLVVNAVTEGVIDLAYRRPLPGQAEFTVILWCDMWHDRHPYLTPQPLSCLCLHVCSDQCQRANLPVHQHDRDLHPLPRWGLPETSLPGDKRLYPGQTAPAEREPAAGTYSICTYVHTVCADTCTYAFKQISKGCSCTKINTFINGKEQQMGISIFFFFFFYFYFVSGF